jgi:hypothetical protein
MPKATDNAPKPSPIQLTTTADNPIADEAFARLESGKARYRIVLDN